MICFKLKSPVLAKNPWTVTYFLVNGTSSFRVAVYGKVNQCHTIDSLLYEYDGANS